LNSVTVMKSITEEAIQIYNSNFTDIPTSIENKPIVITEFKLEQNYPNPFNPSTKISWQSPVSSHQTLKVYDVLGNEVATLVNEYKTAGSYEVEFNASSLSSGVYFYRLQAGSFVQTRKMILIK
ncbi:MAG: T9SS type A sorting domain-containing protein, partial [Ignavibacteriaceae bacterium]|nr:T9SS type A sorting domain-containing protein [Ignavibacteriaceae bacterium]